MKNFIDYIHVNNFKSVSDLKLNDCRHINLFIGYPNVGKSNVLEALSLFSIPFLEKGENLSRFIRTENKNELFYNSGSKSLNVETNLEKITLHITSQFFLLRETFNGEIMYEFSQNLDVKNIGVGFDESETGMSNIKRYIFQPKNQWKSTGNELLIPPFGENIIDTLSYNESVADVKAWMKQEFSKYGLEYILDKSSNSLEVQRRLGNDEVFQLPYSSIADTLQRIIFYKTAIASNKNSVLLFEEPEAHAFPPYIRTITQDMIDSREGQSVFYCYTQSNYCERFY